jgi:hypothetical protein
MNPEILWKEFPHGGLRTCVRKAEKEGLEVRDSSDLRDLEEYRVEPNQRRRQEVSLGIHAMLRREKAKLFVTRHHDRIIAQAIVFFQNNKAYLWNMSSIPSTWRMHPNHILIWHMMKWAYNSGINSIDFGTVWRRSGSYYFVRRNLAGYDQVDHVVLTLPINRLWCYFGNSLATAYSTLNAHGLWVPRARVPPVIRSWFRRRLAATVVSSLGHASSV